MPILTDCGGHREREDTCCYSPLSFARNSDVDRLTALCVIGANQATQAVENNFTLGALNWTPSSFSHRQFLSQALLVWS
jgi:hypothetical protein